MAMNTDMLVQMYKLNQLQQPWWASAASTATMRCAVVQTEFAPTNITTAIA